METIELLTKAGLGAPDARTYLALYRLQEAQSGRLAREANVPTSKVYAILEHLIDQGLVSVRLQNNIKVFQAAPPEALSALIEAKERALAEEKVQLVQAVSHIKQTKVLDAPYSRYKYFEGMNGIKSLWNEVAEKMHDDTLLIHTGTHESYAPLFGFYSEFHKQRVQKRIPAKILFSIGDTELATQRKKLPLTEVRFDSIGTLSEVSVVNDMVVIQHLGKEPHGFLIQDQIFADTFKEIFGKIWARAKER